MKLLLRIPGNQTWKPLVFRAISHGKSVGARFSHRFFQSKPEALGGCHVGSDARCRGNCKNLVFLMMIWCESHENSKRLGGTMKSFFKKRDLHSHHWDLMCFMRILGMFRGDASCGSGSSGCSVYCWLHHSCCGEGLRCVAWFFTRQWMRSSFSCRWDGESMFEHYDLPDVYCISCRILSGKKGMSTIE